MYELGWKNRHLPQIRAVPLASFIYKLVLINKIEYNIFKKILCTWKKWSFFASNTVKGQLILSNNNPYVGRDECVK